jgi:hypothetical protein
MNCNRTALESTADKRLWFINEAILREATPTCVHWYLRGLRDRELVPTHILLSDERWFNLSAYLNSPNNRYCSTGYTLLIHAVPLRDVKVGVWCAVSVARIIGQCFCETFHLTPMCYMH